MGDFQVTDVRVRLIQSIDDKLIGYCTITLNNAFVVKDIKIINNDSGPFVAMPSRKVSESCPRCNGKNHTRANYCNDCGAKIERGSNHDGGRERLHIDIVHPINAEVRAQIHEVIMNEVERCRSRMKTSQKPRS